MSHQKNLSDHVLRLWTKQRCKKQKTKKLLTVFCYVTNTRPVYEMWHLHADFIHKESFHWGSKKQTNKQKLQWTYLVLVVAKVLFWCLTLHAVFSWTGLIAPITHSADVIFLFSQLPHLQCVLSCQGAAIFRSVFILLPLIHPFSTDSLFPKWPPTPAMTLFTKLTRAPAEIGPASGKSTLTSFINWISWPLLSVQRGCGA